MDLYAQFRPKNAIHKESEDFGRQIIELGLQPYSEVGVEKGREIAENICWSLSVHEKFDGEELELTVPSPNSLNGIPVSIYIPASRSKVPPILIFSHGGGLVLCSRKSNESCLKFLARDSGAIIINPEYRRLPLPDAPYAPFDDIIAVTKWVLGNKEAVGGASNSKVGVGGDSGGGTLAITATNEVKGIDFQVLVYPMADTSLSNPTVKEFSAVPGLDEGTLKFFIDHSFKFMPDYLTNPKINGMARTNTELSPPALIILAELDPLRGCGEDYAEKLRAAGVKVQLEIIKGVPHAFFNLNKCFKTTSAEATARIAKFLKQFQ